MTMINIAAAAAIVTKLLVCGIARIGSSRVRKTARTTIHVRRKTAHKTIRIAIHKAGVGLREET